MSPFAVWVTLIIMTAFHIGLVGILDLYLIAHGDPSITSYLREHVWWFFSPIIIMHALEVVLYVHLFVVARNGGGH